MDKNKTKLITVYCSYYVIFYIFYNLLGSSDWWNRKLIDEYVPIVRKQDLKPIYKQFGWKF